MFIVGLGILLTPVDVYLGSSATRLAKREGANATAGRDKICSSMGGSFSNTGNFGFRFNHNFRFCFVLDGDNVCFDLFFRDFFGLSFKGLDEIDSVVPVDAFEFSPRNFAE
jgi:hypothetical protein